MNNFYMPTRVFEDHDCVKKHERELATFGKKALIVTGKSSSRKNGSLEDVTNALQNQNVKYVLFDGVEENPSTDTVLKAAEYGMNNSVDYVIAIGGGSPIDAAKAIALLIKNKIADSSYLYDKNVSSEALPVVAIPTTCGTGSEVTGVSVLTVHDKQTKCSLPHKIFPRLALIDGKYLKYASVKLKNDTALDALSHLWESYINTQTNDYCRMLVREGLDTWAKIKPVVAGEKTATDEDYMYLMRAATLAGMAIAHAGTTLPHSLSYAVTYELGLSHGRAVGQFLSGYLALSKKEDAELMLNLSGFSDLNDFDEFFNKIYGREELSEDIKSRIIKEVYTRKEKLAMVPFDVDEEILSKIVNYR